MSTKKCICIQPFECIQIGYEDEEKILKEWTEIKKHGIYLFVEDRCLYKDDVVVRYKNGAVSVFSEKEFFKNYIILNDELNSSLKYIKKHEDMKKTLKGLSYWGDYSGPIN